MKQPDYRHHIIAVDADGSALHPVCDVTRRVDGEPVAWSVKYKKWDTENTAKVGDDWRISARREFVTYLEGTEGKKDAQGREAEHDGLFENYQLLRKAGAVDRVVIYIHGGLNFISGAGEKACELTHAMLKDRAYPIFIVWNSNLFETYGQHLVGVREGVAEPGFFGMVTAPFQLLADVCTALSRTPLALTKLFRNDLHQLRPQLFQRYQQAEARYQVLDAACRDPRTSGGQIQVSRGFDHRKYLKRVEDLQSWATWAPLRAATTPVIDTFGAAAWRNMLRRTRVMFERESSFVRLQTQANACLEDQRGLRSLSRQGALAYFFARGERRFAITKEDRPAITLIGHSMGAIIAGEILARFPGVPFENVVFMAAASSVNDFKIKVAPYLATHPTRFYNLCLHSFHESGERALLPQPELAPRGSLLIWIDAMFETPIAEDDRTMGRWENAMIATDWIPDTAAGRTTIKGFGRDQLSDTDRVPFAYEADPKSKHQSGQRLVEPRHHGDFSQYGVGKRPNYLFWRPYFWSKEPITGVTDETLRLPPVRSASASAATRASASASARTIAPRAPRDSRAPAPRKSARPAGSSR